MAALSASAAGDGLATTYGTGCDEPATGLAGGGLLATFARPDPAGGSVASWSLDVPPGVTMRSVELARRTLGLGGAPISGDPLRYLASTTSAQLESDRLDDASSAALSGRFVADPAAGDAVRASVDCDLGADLHCAAGPAGSVAAQVTAIAIGVDDDDPPRGAVGGVSDPAAGTLALSLRATDVGVGLSSAQASLDGVVLAATALGPASCRALSPAGEPIDLRAAAGCPAAVTDVALALDTTRVADGRHRLQVRVVDAAGNATTLIDEAIEVHNAVAPQHPSVELTIGRPSSAAAAAPARARLADRGVGGCLRPQLSMLLAQAPLRSSRGVAILRARQRYRFAGRLTCRPGARRVSAPRHTPIDVLSLIHGRTLTKSGTTTRAHGAITIILAYASSRTVEFRYRPAGGSVARVRIRVIVRRASRPYGR